MVRRERGKERLGYPYSLDISFLKWRANELLRVTQPSISDVHDSDGDDWDDLGSRVSSQQPQAHWSCDQRCIWMTMLTILGLGITSGKGCHGFKVKLPQLFGDSKLVSMYCHPLPEYEV